MEDINYVFKNSLSILESGIDLYYLMVELTTVFTNLT